MLPDLQGGDSPVVCDDSKDAVFTTRKTQFLPLMTRKTEFLPLMPLMTRKTVFTTDDSTDAVFTTCTFAGRALSMIAFVILTAGLLEGDSGGRPGACVTAQPPLVQGVVGNVVWSPSLRPACVSLLGTHHARRRIGLRAGARSDDDVFGEDFPSYHSVPDEDVSASDGAPQFTGKRGPSGALEWGAFVGVARRSPPALSEDDMTEGLKERVYYVMLDAFDNYPPQEVSRMLDLLWAAGPNAGPSQNSVRQLVQLTAEVEAIAKASRDRSAIPGEAHGVPSQISRVAVS